VLEIEQVGGEHSNIFKETVIGIHFKDNVGPKYSLRDITVHTLENQYGHRKGAGAWAWQLFAHDQSNPRSGPIVMRPSIDKFRTFYFAQSGRNTLIYKDAEFYGCVAVKPKGSEKDRHKLAICAKMDLDEETTQWILDVMDDAIRCCDSMELHGHGKKTMVYTPNTTHSCISDLTWNPSGRISRTCSSRLFLYKGIRECGGQTYFQASSIPPDGMEALSDPDSDFLVLFGQNKCDLILIYGESYYRVEEYKSVARRVQTLGANLIADLSFRCTKKDFNAKDKKWIAKNVSKSM